MGRLHDSVGGDSTVMQAKKGERTCRVGRRNDVHAWGKGNWVDFWGSNVFWTKKVWTNGPFEQ